MIRIYIAVLATLAGQCAAQSIENLTNDAVETYRAEVHDWFAIHGFGEFDYTTLNDNGIMVHRPDGDEPVTRHAVELVGRRDNDTDACTWGWALDEYPLLGRAASTAVQTYGTENGIGALAEGTVSLGFEGCSNHMALATHLGDIDLIVGMIIDGTTYFFGFPDLEGTT